MITKTVRVGTLLPGDKVFLFQGVHEVKTTKIIPSENILGTKIFVRLVGDGLLSISWPAESTIQKVVDEELEEIRSPEEILKDMVEFIEEYVHEMVDSRGNSLMTDFSGIMAEAIEYLEEISG